MMTPPPNFPPTSHSSTPSPPPFITLVVSSTSRDARASPYRAVARKYADEYCTSTLGYAAPNMRFVKGTIEDLKAADVPDGSADLIISNCVINLSPDKPAVLSEAHRALADGGEFYFSDVYCDRRLPEELRSHEILLGECLVGRGAGPEVFS